jgi:ribosome biogenesis GTPase
MSLQHLGWTPDWAQHFACYQRQNLVPARVIREDREAYTVTGGCGERLARVTGRLRHQATGRADFPAVGDWVALELPPGDGPAAIHAVLPRRSLFSRKGIGSAGDEQIVATNVDTVLLVSGLDGDFNVRRIERYLTLAWESGAVPAIVLNKADVCDDLAARLTEVEAVAPGAAVHIVSAQDGRGLDELHPYVRRGQTVAMLGSSGVGKSSLINALLGHQRQRTAAVREDDSHGRHTTTHRELILVPDGGVIIDTPGMRELQLWAGDDALGSTFADVEKLATECRFRDCGHSGEPDCAIRAALASGALSEARYESYVKLRRELAYLARRDDVVARLAERDRWKRIHIMAKRHGRPRL